MAAGGRKGLDDLFHNFAESSLLFLGLVLVVGIGIWVVSWIRSRLADDEGSQAGDHRLLSQIADLREQGDLTDEEYRSIKGRLVKRLDDTVSANGETPSQLHPSQSTKSHDSDLPENGGGNFTSQDASGG